MPCSGTPVDLTAIHALFLLLLLNMFRHTTPILHLTEPRFTLPSPPLRSHARISRIRHTPPFQMPLLNTPNNIHTQLPILLQRILPMLRDRITESQESRNTIHHHLPHDIILVRIRIYILHPPQPRVGFVVVIESPHRLHHILAQFYDLELLAQEVQIEEGADILFRFWVAQGATVEPADEELKGEIV